MRVALLLPLALLVIPGAGAAAGPTDIARVDDYIDAARAVRAHARRARAPARGADAGAAARGHDRVVLARPRGRDVALGAGGGHQRARGGAAAALRPRRRRAAYARRGGAGPGAGHDGRARLLPRRRRGPELGGVLFSRPACHADRVALLGGLSALKRVRRGRSPAPAIRPCRSSVLYSQDTG